MIKAALATFNYDASACYDRIVVPLAMLAAWRLGMNDALASLFAIAFQNMSFRNSTGYGVSEHLESPSAKWPVFGVGQGSGAAPCAWLIVSVILFSVLRQTSQGMDFMDPTGSVRHARTTDGFVDDATSGESDAHLDRPMGPSQLTTRIQQTAQSWERLLHTSGGALQFQKCFYYAIMWNWKHGIPCMIDVTEKKYRVSIAESETGKQTAIQQRLHNQSHKTLGVRLTPNGSFHDEFKHLRAKAEEFKLKMLQSRLSSTDAIRAYNTRFLPSITYSACLATFKTAQQKAIFSPAVTALLWKLHCPSTMTRNVVFGSNLLGGIGIYAAECEFGLHKIRLLLGHTIDASDLAKLIQVNLGYFRLIAGTADCPLRMANVEMPHLQGEWFCSLRAFLESIDAYLVIQHPMKLTPAREHDVNLMDHVLHHCSPEEI